ncbi:ABC transporter permease [Gryllotalpicola reticulitermitis]|uniref:ABC transporter permease n=1 Tax=Gryllotalpicola reticulitermitis TaxID=1184153 RepID=A0ABV8QBW4_9MICO
MTTVEPLVGEGPVLGESPSPLETAPDERLRRRGAVRRLIGAIGSSVFVLWGAATVTFIAINVMPGDPAVAMAGGVQSHPSHAVVAAIDAQYGFNKPIFVQYLLYLGRLVQGQLGYSSTQKQQVVTVIGQNLGATLLLTVSALVLAWLLAIASSLVTVKRGRIGSAVGSAIEVLAAALPQYWLGILLLEVFAFRLGWIPATGGTGFIGLILPGLTLGIPLAGFMSQVTREEFESTLEQPFVTSARSRGMSDWGVRIKHGLRHAALPGLTLSGWALGSLISGAVIVETLFSRQGLGNMLLQAVTQQDMPLTVGITLIVALVYVVANIVVDALYVVADPRLRTS